MVRQSGGVLGPDNEITHYVITKEGEDDAVITFGSEERPGSHPMYVIDLLDHLHQRYHVPEPDTGWRKVESFTDAEKAKLRPIAETLAMLDGNAFLSMKGHQGRDWYESYLPEAAALYENNGGDNGWSGAASFAKGST